MVARVYVALICLFVWSIPVLSISTAFGQDVSRQVDMAVVSQATNNTQDKHSHSNNLDETISLLQQRIQNLQSLIIDQDIKYQSEVEKLQDALAHQENAIKRLARDGDEDSHMSLLLTALGVLIAVVTIVITFFGVIGFFGIKKSATIKAKETAETVTMAEIKKGTFDTLISAAVQDVFNRKLDTGAFNPAIEAAVQKLAFSTAETEDELAQEENENRAGG